MKSNVIKTFKQTYTDKNNIQRSFCYNVTIVKDTEDYTYRILNLDSFSIWKAQKFKTYKEALKFIEKHPHNLENQENR